MPALRIVRDDDRIGDVGVAEIRDRELDDGLRAADRAPREQGRRCGAVFAEGGVADVRARRRDDLRQAAEQAFASRRV